MKLLRRIDEVRTELDEVTQELERLRVLYEETGEDSLNVEDDLTDIAKGFPYGKCKDAAEEMQDYLTKNKLHGAIITLEWIPCDVRMRYIWSDIANKEVGTVPIRFSTVL